MEGVSHRAVAWLPRRWELADGVIYAWPSTVRSLVPASKLPGYGWVGETYNWAGRFLWRPRRPESGSAAPRNPQRPIERPGRDTLAHNRTTAADAVFSHYGSSSPRS